MKPHKHAELIKAWADGAEVERLTEIGDWLPDNDTPEWLEDVVYRIKPKEPVVRWLWAYRSMLCDSIQVSKDYKTEEEAWQSWYGATFYKKLEWSREEFPE